MVRDENLHLDYRIGLGCFGMPISYICEAAMTEKQCCAHAPKHTVVANVNCETWAAIELLSRRLTLRDGQFVGHNEVAAKLLEWAVRDQVHERIARCVR